MPAPMPLKYPTETTLILVLGLVTLLVGVLTDTLPLLPEGILPWGLVFGSALLYGLLLYPLLRRNRAEYAFRALHFLPAAIALLWFLIQVLALLFPEVLALHRYYTYGWTAVGVIASFLLLAWFCLRVLRRFSARILLLALVLIPFVSVGFFGERFADWDQKLAAFLWQGTWWDVVGTGTFLADLRPLRLAQQQEDEVNVLPSDSLEEEVWRKRLRSLQRRRERLAKHREEGTQESALASLPELRKPTKTIVQVEIPPPRLPSSGFGVGTVAVMTLAGYCGVLHQRARNRV